MSGYIVEASKVQMERNLRRVVSQPASILEIVYLTLLEGLSAVNQIDHSLIAWPDWGHRGRKAAYIGLAVQIPVPQVCRLQTDFSVFPLRVQGGALAYQPQ